MDPSRTQQGAAQDQSQASLDRKHQNLPQFLPQPPATPSCWQGQAQLHKCHQHNGPGCSGQLHRLCEVSLPAQPSQVKARLVSPQAPVYSPFRLPGNPSSCSSHFSFLSQPAWEHGLAAGKQLCMDKVLPATPGTSQQSQGATSACPISSQSSCSSWICSHSPCAASFLPAAPAQGTAVGPSVMQQKRKP